MIPPLTVEESGVKTEWEACLRSYSELQEMSYMVPGLHSEAMVFELRCAVFRAR